VVGALPVDARVERASVEGSPIAQVDRSAIITDQVHLRAHEAFVWGVMQTSLKDHQVARALRIQGQGVVDALRV